MMIKHRWGSLLFSFVIVVASAVTITSPATASASGSVQANGEWPGLGKICGPGPGGASSGRGVGAKSLDIATFADPNNSVQPGLNIQLFQAANAFSKWCNASGGIDGRKLVVHDRDGGLFNAAQVTSQACEQDFMAVGGGLVLDQPAVPVRVACGLGQISGFVVSDAAVNAALQVNPVAFNDSIDSTGYYSALARRYPRAVKHFGIGAENNPSIVEPSVKWRQSAESQGYKTVNWQVVPLSVSDWTSYVEQSHSAGVEALQPPDDGIITPYVQAMNTAGYSPTFMLLNGSFYVKSTIQAAAQSKFPPTYVPVAFWPFELESQSPGLQQLTAIMHKYSKGDSVDWEDEQAFDGWILFAKAATACGAGLTVSCTLKNAASQKNWTGGGLAAPVAHLALAQHNPTPSPCFVIMQVQPNKFVYDKAVTHPNSSIWNCDTKGLIHVTSTTG
jgi:ABC-type branched-subunit amino acid transport system substrate-binding protein